MAWSFILCCCGFFFPLFLRCPPSMSLPLLLFLPHFFSPFFSLLFTLLVLVLCSSPVLMSYHMCPICTKPSLYLWSPGIFFLPHGPLANPTTYLRVLISLAQIWLCSFCQHHSHLSTVALKWLKLGCMNLIFSFFNIAFLSLLTLHKIIFARHGQTM